MQWSHCSRIFFMHFHGFAIHCTPFAIHPSLHPPLPYVLVFDIIGNSRAFTLFLTSAFCNTPVWRIKLNDLDVVLFGIFAIVLSVKRLSVRSKLNWNRWIRCIYIHKGSRAHIHSMIWGVSQYAPHKVTSSSSQPSQYLIDTSNVQTDQSINYMWVWMGKWSCMCVYSKYWASHWSVGHYRFGSTEY